MVKKDRFEPTAPNPNVSVRATARESSSNNQLGTGESIQTWTAPYKITIQFPLEHLINRIASLIELPPCKRACLVTGRRNFPPSLMYIISPSPIPEQLCSCSKQKPLYPQVASPELFHRISQSTSKPPLSSFQKPCPQ